MAAIVAWHIEGMDSITFSDQREKECIFQNRHTLAAYNATQSVF